MALGSFHRLQRSRDRDISAVRQNMLLQDSQETDTLADVDSKIVFIHVIFDCMSGEKKVLTACTKLYTIAHESIQKITEPNQEMGVANFIFLLTAQIV